MTGDNLSIEAVGLKELKCWHDKAPKLIRLLRPIINGFRYFEKWLAGGYSEKFPLTYSIYVNDNKKGNVLDQQWKLEIYMGALER